MKITDLNPALLAVILLLFVAVGAGLLAVIIYRLGKHNGKIRKSDVMMAALGFALMAFPFAQLIEITKEGIRVLTGFYEAKHESKADEFAKTASKVEAQIPPENVDARTVALVLGEIDKALPGKKADTDLNTNVDQEVRLFRIGVGDKRVLGVVVWTATVSTTFTRHGSASKWNHPVDTRSCSWRSTGVITRNVLLLNEATGHLEPIEGIPLRILSSDKERGPSNFVEAAGGYHATCGDSMGRIRSSHESAIAAMRAVVGDVVQADVRDVEAEFLKVFSANTIEPIAAGSGESEQESRRPR